MTRLACLLIPAFLAVALVPASPSVAAGGHAKKAKKAHVAKKKVKKTKRATRARTALPSDPGTALPTDPGTALPSDPGTALPSDPATALPGDPATTVPPQPTGNPAQQCKAEMADPGFAETYGTNHNNANAFGKCVSAHAHASHKA
jgi:hypothetical protein